MDFRMHNDVILVKTSDYQGLYINGKLALEDFRIDFEKGMGKLMELEGSVSKFKILEVNDFDDNFPEYLTTLKSCVKINL